jgi:hypothetical protein
MSRTQMKMAPDAGTTNNGVAPVIGQCGRGIQRTGDIRHIGDNVPQSASAKAQTETLTPGTNSFSLQVPYGDVQAGPPGGSNSPMGFEDAEGTSFTVYSGGDASGEGFDGYSGKQGKEN